MANTTLEATVQDLREGADDYQAATNFEAKLQQYTNSASSLQISLQGLKNRLEGMEQYNGVYTEVFGHDTPNEVDIARSRAQGVLEQTEEEYWQLIKEGEVDGYKSKVQNARSKADKAREHLRDGLNQERDQWVDRIRAARQIQPLMADSRDADRLLDDIEGFVTKRMWEDDARISTLQSEWQALQRKRESGVVVDWEEFQDRYGLDDGTITILERLASGDEISFEELDERVVDDMLSASELRNALKVTL